MCAKVRVALVRAFGSPSGASANNNLGNEELDYPWKPLRNGSSVTITA